MRSILLLLLALPLATGCKSDRFVLKTKVDTRLDAPPVSPTAGPVRPVVVQAGPSRVAIIDVDGLILNTPFVGPLSVGENPVALFREKLDAAACDPCVKAVVLRVNSAGGGVAACISMRHDLERFKERTHLPVVACLMDTAAGGAYYLASAADQIVAGPATVTGGLGVILNLYNLRDLMQQFNVIPQPVIAGARGDIGTSTRRLTEGEKQLLQTMADEFHAQLISDIQRSRPGVVVRMDTPNEGTLFGWNLDRGNTFDGRIFTGSQALTRGLVDHVGDLDEALQLAAQMGCRGPAARPAVHLCRGDCSGLLRMGRRGPAAQSGVVMYRRTNDPARSIYAITANVPLQGTGLFPSLPGLDRAKMPTFLSLWQPELSIEKLGGK